MRPCANVMNIAAKRVVHASSMRAAGDSVAAMRESVV